MNFLDPALLKSVAPFIVILLLRDLSFAALARLKAKVLATPDKADDWLADVIDVVVGVANKIPFPSMPWSKK